jgi:hypothetical protein
MLMNGNPIRQLRVLLIAGIKSSPKRFAKKLERRLLRLRAPTGNHLRWAIYLPMQCLPLRLMRNWRSLIQVVCGLI